MGVAVRQHGLPGSAGHNFHLWEDSGRIASLAPSLRIARERLDLFLTACAIPTLAELEPVAVQSDEAVPEMISAEPIRPETTGQSETPGLSLFGVRELVDLKDGSPLSFNRDWGIGK